MMQKRTLYSLLLTSFILVSAFSVASAQQVTVESAALQRCVVDTLDISVTNPADISAYEVVLAVSGDISVLDILHTAPANWDVFDTLDGSVIRLAGLKLGAGAACLGAGGPTVVAQVVIATDNICSGSGGLDGTTYVCPNNPLVSASTQVVDCATGDILPAAVTAGTVTIQNVAPSIDPLADDSLHAGVDSYLDQATASDADLANGCEKLSFSKVSGPANLTVNATSGVIQWTPLCADVGVHTVQVAVTDSCGAADTTSFEICVWQLPPVITCPAETLNIIWGDIASGQVTAVDPDNCTTPLLYALVSSPGGLNVPTINAATGEWEWDTEEDNAYIGVHQLCFSASDGSNLAPGCSPNNADSCCLYVRIIPTIRAYIEKTHNSLQGQLEQVCIYLDESIDPPNEMGGYDLLIAYDRSALNFQSAVPGALLNDCGWEYFTYRTWFWPSYEPHFFWGGIVRLVAIADMNNGNNHPSCFAPGPGELACLTFIVTDNRLFECQYVPIRWFWADCGDNTISSKSGDTLFVSRHIYNFDDLAGNNPLEDPNLPFPHNNGINAVCFVDTGDGKPDLIPLIDFWHGGVDIVCAESIDARGDINLNGVSNEIADAVVLTNYFIYGIGAFHINVAGQTAASDVNADGLALTVGDLVYLIRVIVGDALPYPKVTTPVAAEYLHTDAGVLRVDEQVPMGAAFVVLSGDQTPILLAPGMEMKYGFDGVNTRVLVYSFDGTSFTGEVLQAGGSIVSIELATREGNPVTAELIPEHFALEQNYPNPFNPSTTISFSLPQASDYNLVIYNVNGQMVKRFSGAAEAGVVDVIWEAGSHASGVYFYKLEAGSFSATKKMVLLK
jgi:hypothetical protein